ncbi:MULTISPECIES: hypothetical protein [Pseudooceanicola]|uniref:hypothetical protein n=1 Tax=Pseudooceanicola TaxID=1679449 RepID=UPI0028804C53|nr:MULTISPECIES: hypothetical protein [Pseudooceanicola]
MSQILVMTRSEPVGLDPERLRQLYAQLGEAGADNVVCRAMEELALRFSHADRMLREGRREELRKAVRSLAAIADQVGMTLLSRVAGDVGACLGGGDDVALAATFARLLRVGESSLMAIWELQDITL